MRDTSKNVVHAWKRRVAVGMSYYLPRVDFAIEAEFEHSVGIIIAAAASVPNLEFLQY